MKENFFENHHHFNVIIPQIFQRSHLKIFIFNAVVVAFVVVKISYAVFRGNAICWELTEMRKMIIP